jgi:hypothetical protein
MKRKNNFLVSQKQAKMKRNQMHFASFRFEAKIEKERKRDTLLGGILNNFYVIWKWMSRFFYTKGKVHLVTAEWF